MRTAGRHHLASLVLALCLGALLASCTAPEVPLVKRGGEAGEEKPVLSRREVIAKLPCFNCHLMEDFMAEPAPGVFSHQLHGDFGVHCNQCHEVGGHERPTIYLAACGSCHSLARLSYAGGGMGKVAFNHEFHAAAFACGACHPSPFKMKKGASAMTMDGMYKGGLCGKCHDGRQAFASTDCTKCHRG
ncbi:MAG: hypothetical protein Kow0025_09280 [Thermodesulfovibrionales bacterium]